MPSLQSVLGVLGLLTWLSAAFAFSISPSTSNPSTSNPSNTPMDGQPIVKPIPVVSGTTGVGQSISPQGTRLTIIDIQPTQYRRDTDPVLTKTPAPEQPGPGASVLPGTPDDQFGVSHSPLGQVIGQVISWGGWSMGNSKDLGVNFGLSLPLAEWSGTTLLARGRMDLAGAFDTKDSNVIVSLDALLSRPLNSEQMEVYVGPSVGTMMGRGLSVGGMAGLRRQVVGRWGWYAEGQLRSFIDQGKTTVLPSLKAGVTFRF